MVEEDIYAGAGPWARVQLPRGQELRVIVTGRRRVKGGWWYEVEALLWMRTLNPDGTSRPEQAPTTFTVPANLVEPIPGMDYTAVPTLDETAPRPWVLLVIRQPDIDGPRAVLHRADCAQARGGIPATDTEAEDAVREGGTVPCQVCHPERARRWRLGSATLALRPRCFPRAAGLAHTAPAVGCSGVAPPCDRRGNNFLEDPLNGPIVLTREQFYILRAEVEEHNRQAARDEMTLDSNGMPDCAPHCPRCQQRAGSLSVADGSRSEFFISFQPCGHEFALPPGEHL